MAETTSGTPAGVSSAKEVTPTPNPDTGANASAAVLPLEPNLDVLLGVNLNLTLRFGQRLLPLREILDLNTGVIIELDREVEEPADLLLGDRVIARGQVVIVNGNYGLRVTEVMEPQ
jgi:flagellar motor switch protein FliN/FliY